MNNVYLSILVMTLLAGVLAGILSFAYSRLKVEEDPKVKKIEELLTGVNCGACGFANCEEFARKLAEGKVSIDKCKITARNKEIVEKIEDIIEK